MFAVHRAGQDSSRLPGKPVSEPEHGVDKSGSCRISFQFSPQTGDMNIDGARSLSPAGPPDFPQELLARKSYSPVFDEVPEQLKFPRAK